MSRVTKNTLPKISIPEKTSPPQAQKSVSSDGETVFSIRTAANSSFTLLDLIERLPIELRLMIAEHLSTKRDLLTLTALSPCLHAMRFSSKNTLSNKGVFNAQIWSRLPYKPGSEIPSALCHKHLKTLTLSLPYLPVRGAHKKSPMTWEQLQQYCTQGGLLPYFEKLILLRFSMHQIKCLTEKSAQFSPAVLNQTRHINTVHLEIPNCDAFTLSHLMQSNNEDSRIDSANFPRMVQLEIAINGHFPYGLGTFTDLTHLKLIGISLSAPQGWGTFPRLQHLAIYTTCPDLLQSLGQLSRLVQLAIHKPISHLPQGLGRLENLTYLEIGDILNIYPKA